MKHAFSLNPKLRNKAIEQMRNDAIHRDNISCQMQELLLSGKGHKRPLAVTSYAQGAKGYTPPHASTTIGQGVIC